jgi:hypothetical protein
VFSPNESIRILLPEGNIDKVCEKSAKITLKGEYRDIFGQVFKLDDVIDAKETVEQAKQLRPILEKDIADEVEGIKDGLKKVADEVHYIRRELEKEHEHDETA